MTATPRTFVGFGFGAIQAGLFLYEAFRSRNFQRLVVAEVVPEVVEAVRRARGCYRVNIAAQSGIQAREVRGLEIFNPSEPADAQALAEALAEASEVCTALPSVEFYSRGRPSVAELLGAAMQRKAAHPGLPRCIIYTAENHNHAAEILQGLCEQGLDEKTRAPFGRTAQYLNTVIGKMSGVVTGPEPIRAEGLACLTDGFARAFLVEEFNRILITRITLPGFKRGIEVFIEKPDLLPFEEAKLYGHNAVHALIGYLARRNGCLFMSEAAGDPQLMTLAREAFLAESGPALIARHQGLDPLFSPAGFEAYGDDLLNRMVNPYLRDRTERVTRDPRRKLAWEDRLVGTMRLALDAGLAPERFALGAAAALETLSGAGDVDAQLRGLWPVPDQPPGRKSQLIGLISQAQKKLASRRCPVVSGDGGCARQLPITDH
jgi:mannitol-1-phosphate 5-dehydrogenase